MSRDSIYTPGPLAASMVEAAGELDLAESNCIGDFAAGHGELLAAARSKWPLATVVATDIDRRAIRLLKRSFPPWKTGTCDFLNARSRGQCSALKELALGADLVLLNPPFSCRGGTRVSASASGVGVKCSAGLAFLVNSIDYLAPGGVLVSLLLSGSLTSEKDTDTWELLRRLGDICVVTRNGHRAFEGAVIRTVVVRFAKGLKAAGACKPSARDDGSCRKEYRSYDRAIEVSLVRGNLPMHAIQIRPKGQGIPLVHTTDLREGRISFDRWVGNRRAHPIAGPLVLIPRVGNPDRKKLTIHKEDFVFALSDCLLAVVCKTPDDAGRLLERLSENWHVVEQAYVGSAAKYVTVGRFGAILRELGYVATNTGD